MTASPTSDLSPILVACNASIQLVATGKLLSIILSIDAIVLSSRRFIFQ